MIREKQITLKLRYCDAPGCDQNGIVIVNGPGVAYDLCWRHYEEVGAFTATRLGVKPKRGVLPKFNLGAADVMAWLEVQSCDRQ